MTRYSVLFQRILPAMAFLLVLSGCLKTRAQLREDQEVGPAPEKAHVEEVRPQGQYVIDEIKSEMTRLQGRIEDIERSQKDAHQTASRAGSEEQKKLEARIIELEQAQANMLEEIKRLRETPAHAADPGEAYEKGKTHFEAGELDAAVEQFSAYLKSPKAKRAEEALFYRGESYFALKQFKKAIVDYSKFPEKYTKSKHMPQALYKIGLSFESLGMKSDAQGFFAEVVEKFPKSAEAKKARAKLK
jgi:tol-pal system protein YbgF